MRPITKPTYTSGKIYEECLNGIGDQTLKNRLSTITSTIINAENDYDQKALSENLYQLPANYSHESVAFINGLTKKELKSVYSQYMVPVNKPARTYYDQLIALAPYGKCPYCGYGDAETIDHYLPKAQYPLLSTIQYNLIPSCRDCNTGRNNAIATISGEQILHPYYDHHLILRDQWLFAEVKETAPATIIFYVHAPDNWNDVHKERVNSHFTVNKLADRYSLQAGDELSTLKNTLSIYFIAQGVSGIKLNLSIQAISEYSKYINSWKTAMYQALSASDWYCNGGYLNG